VPDIDQRTNALRYGIWPMLLEHGMAPVLRATFVSILLPRETFLKHGYPIAAMFIWGEDTEFTLRMTRLAPGFLCSSSRVTHVRAAAGSLDIQFEKAIHRMSWHKCLVRNNLYVARRYRSTLVLLVRIARWLTKAVRLAVIGELRKAWIILTGVVSGIFFRPKTHMLDEDELGTELSYISASLHARITANCIDSLPHWVTADNMLQM
jgi:dTDP-4-dehydrorhamnose reductase